MQFQKVMPGRADWLAGRTGGLLGRPACLPTARPVWVLAGTTQKMASKNGFMTKNGQAGGAINPLLPIKIPAQDAHIFSLRQKEAQLSG